MKSLLTEYIEVTAAVGYNDTLIELNEVYYTVGNSFYRYKITNIIDRSRVEYIIDSCYVEGEWLPFTGQNNPQIMNSWYFISYNVYATQYCVFP